MAANPSHWLHVRDRLECLRRMMLHLAGDARMSLEGDLSRCQFPAEIVMSRAGVPGLERNSPPSQTDIVVLSLTSATVEPILEQVRVAGLNQAIVHVQIERNGVREFAAYDNFHRQCVQSGPGVPVSLLGEMRSDGVLQSFEPVR